MGIEAPAHENQRLGRSECRVDLRLAGVKTGFNSVFESCDDDKKYHVSFASAR